MSKVNAKHTSVSDIRQSPERRGMGPMALPELPTLLGAQPSGVPCHRL